MTETKIDLIQAYDQFTQESLFSQVVQDNLDDAGTYGTKDLKRTSYRISAFDDFVRTLLKAYQEAFTNELSDIASDLINYVKVDYSQMLNDDVMNGFVQPIRYQDGSYALLFTAEGITESNLTKYLHLNIALI